MTKTYNMFQMSAAKVQVDASTAQASTIEVVDDDYEVSEDSDADGGRYRVRRLKPKGLLKVIGTQILRGALCTLHSRSTGRY